VTYRIEFRPSVRRELLDIPRKDQARIIRVIEAMEKSPRPRGVKKLKGMENLFRIHVGDYRVIYQILDDILVVLVVRIGHRKDVYR